MIGSIQWAVSLGRLDVDNSVMALASLRADPIQGHIDLCKIVVPCLAKSKHATISIRTEEPDLSSTPTNPHDWEESAVYGKVK